MSSYTISPTLNKSRVFILQKSELEKRFDPFFYVPELLELEKTGGMEASQAYLTDVLNQKGVSYEEFSNTLQRL